ncbi:CABIT domain-containing protein serrano isoform X2 [Xylocopa sonorina]|uniref:CABIT domain-containing protein serrano isoform X2 n=1 Tax=Xylocopa sonorina TaxID=1818115 RepID=UPI00403AC7C7
MAATDGQIVVAAARWAEEATYLREFVSKYRLPAVIKITKGQYGGLGVPTLPAPSLQSTALLVSAGRRRKIVAQAVKIKEGRRVVGVGPRLAIPDSYAGYFEILSEEGRAVRGIESVGELCRRCPDEGALVRETVRGIACRVDDESGIVVPEGTRTLAAGETIVTAGEVSLPGRGRFLRCVDCRGESVLLGMDQRGRFSALAREDNISGVHTARALLSKRLPLTVRLVHGQPPRGLKSSSQFVPELRLLSTFEEEHVFALPLQREGAAVALPLAAPLKLVKARNEEALRSMQEFTRLVERASRLVADVADRAHVLDGRLGESKPSRQTRSGSGFLRRSSTNSDNGPLGHHRNNASHHHHHHHYHSNGHQPSSGHAGYRDENRVPPSACTEEYDEIDQIYDYVRGFAPLPKSVKSPYESPLPVAQSSSPPLTPVTVTIAPLLDDRPEPPPIETIPTKKIQAEKRTRRAVKETPQPRVEKPPLAKLYVKNSGTQRGRPLMRQKSASPLKETPPGYKGGSPLFNIRYKSLTNLQQAMELDGTLDSSHSGGRTSGDSGAGAKLPEKRFEPTKG